MKYFSTEYFEQLKKIALMYALDNYDYCYLKAMHEKNRLIGTKILIVGCSHAMNGIVEKQLECEWGGAINFSTSSQDLYFDFQHIKKAVEEGKQKIEICVINIGYWGLYQTLSYSLAENYRIAKTHYPLLGDSHHCNITEEIDMLENVLFDRNMYSDKWIREFVNEWATGFFMEESTYYGSLTKREDPIEKRNVFIWNEEMSEEEKRAKAVERAISHNGLKAYEHSRQENSALVREMIEYLFHHEISPVFVIFPFFADYNDYIDPEYKKDILSLLEELPWPIEFLDMNDYSEMFEEADFVDADHLSLQGALKATNLLNRYIGSRTLR